MMQYVKNIVTYILLGSGALGFIIIYASLKARGFNWYIFGTGVICLAIPVLVLLVTAFLNRSSDEDDELISLKENGIRVPVDLTHCKIKSNGWTSEVPRYNSSRVEFLNEVSGHGDKNVQRVESNFSVVEYTTKVNGRPRKFTSHVIGKDKISLTMLLEMKKETTIYLDPNNKRNYYFDLEFLEEE